MGGVHWCPKWAFVLAGQQFSRAEWILQDGNHKSKNRVSIMKSAVLRVKHKSRDYEVAVVVNAAWEKSFAWVECNKKAIAVRGWNPLTCKLLDHPKIVETKDQEENSTTVASTMNFGAGVANKIMVDILQNIDCENVRTQIRQNQ